MSVTYSGYAYVASAADVDAPGKVHVTGTTITIGLREAQTVGVGADITVTVGETSAKGMVDAVAFDETDIYKADVTISPALETLVETAFREADVSDPATITLNYERSLEGNVSITVGGGSDVMLKSGFVQAKTFSITAKQARLLDSLQVVGLPETGNVRVPVTAEFTSSGGATLTKTGYAIRSSMIPDSITATTYSCKQDNVELEKMDNPVVDADPPRVADSSMICAVEAKDSTNVSKLTETAAFAPGSMFVIVANVADSAGTAIPMGRTVTGRQTSPLGTTAITVANGLTSGDKNVGEARLVATVKGKDDAALGDYTIEVAQGRALMDVVVSVTGPTTLIMITGDDTIPTATGLGRYTIKATDTNGNVPTDLYSDHDDDDETAMVLSKKVLVAVRVDGVRVLGVNQDTGEVTLDKNGEATFTVQMPQDAVAGTTVSITVYVSGTDITDTAIAMYGEAAPMPMPMPEAGMAMDLMATANDDGSIMLDWTAGMDANWHFLRGDEVGGDAAVVWTYTSASDSHMVPADMLTAGTEYSFIVIAGYFVRNDADGWDGGWSAGWSDPPAMATAMAGN